MMARKQVSNFAIISLSLSLIGLGLLPFILLSPPPNLVIPWQNQLLGTAFTIICILGIIAAISPSHCSQYSKRKNRQELQITEKRSPPVTTNPIRKEGHHPTCDHYSNHVIRVRSRIYCAGCTGLATGAILAVLGSVLFFFGTLRFIFPVMIYWLGWVFVAVGLLQHFIYRLIPVQRSVTRFLINVIFVVGAFFLLASVVQLTDSFILGTYLLVLILFWIFTRIIMSRRSHQRICAQCGTTDCPLSDA